MARKLNIAGPAALFIALAVATTAFGQPATSADIARRIAMSQGMVTIEEIGEDDGVWAVEGRDIHGYDMDIDIDAATGRIIAIKTDEAAPVWTAGAATVTPR